MRETHNSHISIHDYQLSRNIKAKLHRVDSDNGNCSVSRISLSDLRDISHPKCQMNNIESWDILSKVSNGWHWIGRQDNILNEYLTIVQKCDIDISLISLNLFTLFTIVEISIANILITRVSRYSVKWFKIIRKIFIKIWSIKFLPMLVCPDEYLTKRHRYPPRRKMTNDWKIISNAR